MIYISYGTKNTPYESVIKDYLEKSLKFWGLKYYIEYPEDMSSWQANTHYKAEFILKCLKKFNESVVFLDADATIKKFPILFDFIDTQDVDIALHFLDWKKNWRNHSGNKIEALSGSLYLNYTQDVLDFLKAWIEKNKESTQWEQKNMQDVLYTFDLRIEKLPYSYCTIVNQQNQIPAHMIQEKDVVILHHQKSRQYKRFHRDRKRGII